MKCIKKLVALTLAAVLALAMLTACGGTCTAASGEHSQCQHRSQRKRNQFFDAFHRFCPPVNNKIPRQTTRSAIKAV